VTKIAFRSPVEVPLLRFGQPKPPGQPLNATFRITKRAHHADSHSADGKHNAIDIGNFDCGAPIVAMAGGKARRAEDEAHALGVIINHGSGVTTEYWHFEKFVVADGKQVVAGERIGLVGNTGISTACHCHIELKVNGQREDPEPHAFGKPLELAGRARRMTPSGGTDMPLVFKATDFRPITNRQYTTDINANFRDGPSTRATVIKKFPGGVKVIPSGVVKGQAIAGGSPRAGFKQTDWLEVRMKVGANVVLGYFHASVLTNQAKVE
jgi:murein DD-endopeptidase MepM/ murein hydrolase activator NlpD